MFEYRNNITFIKLHKLSEKYSTTKVIWIRTDQIEAVAECENKTYINMIGSENPYVVTESVDEVMRAIVGGNSDK